MKKKFRAAGKTARSNFLTFGIVVAAYIIIMALQSGGMISSAMSGLMVPICAYIVMAVSLNLTVGIMGNLSLGHAGFMSVGAFVGVITAMSLQASIPSGPLRLALSMAVGGLCAGIVSLIVVIPVLRLQGDYLAIVTLAFGEIIKNIVNCLYVGLDKNGLHFTMKNAMALNLDAATGKKIMQGPMGAVGITKLSSLTAGFILIILSLIVVLNLINSRAGRAIMSLRDNRIAAESIGISPARYKIMAFVTSAVLAGMAGTLYAMNFSSILAKKFDFNTSILVLVFVVLGGMGNIRGSIIAAAVLTVLPEMLRQFADYRMLIYAIVLILVMLITNNPRTKQLLAKIRSPKSGKEETEHVL
ncbi:MAG: branched-chain amino acid ABC transporter permease [Oscillibacter sp.]|jgi:branched-chain amino acid transport system permease protein|nr:branched-chain amino acid ABC transporter permease [Oscillibacter sp.]